VASTRFTDILQKRSSQKRQRLPFRLGYSGGVTLFLRGASLYDGFGNPPRISNLLIRADRIAAIDPGQVPGDAEVISLDGLAVAPGFIDLHSHSDVKSLEGDTAKARQGVTTELVGNCGFSAFPNAGCATAVGAYNLGILSDPRTFASAREFLSAAQQGQAASHLESLVGHGTLRTAVRARYPDADLKHCIEFEAALLDEALAEGAAGFSTGLMYAPGATAPREELEALCAITARHGKLYATHMRSYSWQLVESIDEQIALARATGCRLQISHLQAVGAANWHKQPEALERIEAAQSEGIDIGFDAYPYGAGCTVLEQLVPQQELEQGFAPFAVRLANRDHRRNVEHALREQTAQAWSDIYIAFHGPLASGRNVAGKTIAQISELWERAPEAVVLDLLIEADGRVNILSFNQSEKNLRAALTHPLASVITDGIHLNQYSHPRLYGTYPHLLGKLCRDLRWMPLETAIHKITALPASRLGLTDRGRIVVGYRADLVVLDPAAIGTASTYGDPLHNPTGIQTVFRDGRPLNLGNLNDASQ
jgi:N-acyl-D-amino-acid deacylase